MAIHTKEINVKLSIEQAAQLQISLRARLLNDGLLMKEIKAIEDLLEAIKRDKLILDDNLTVAEVKLLAMSALVKKGLK